MIISEIEEVCYTQRSVYGVATEDIEQLYLFEENWWRDSVVTLPDFRFQALLETFDEDPDAFTPEFIALIKPLLEAHDVDEIVFYEGEKNNVCG